MMEMEMEMMNCMASPWMSVVRLGRRCLDGIKFVLTWTESLVSFGN